MDRVWHGIVRRLEYFTRVSNRFLLSGTKEADVRGFWRSALPCITSRICKTSRFAAVVGTAGALATVGKAQESGAGGSGDGPKTVIQSDSLEMHSGQERNYFFFRDEVRVEGTNLIVTCDLLEVVARREGVGDDPDAIIGQFGAIESIVASGKVEIWQAGRRAEAGRAQVLPHEGRVVLTEGPRVYDGQGEVSGWRITLLQDERRALVEADPGLVGDRATVILSELPDLGYEDDEMAESGGQDESGAGDGGEDAGP